MLTLGLFACLSLALAAGPATAATRTARPATPSPSPTPTPIHFVGGRHVYDNGGALTAAERSAAESLAADIEARGGGRVAVVTVKSNADLPDTNALVADWRIDGMLLVGAPPFNGSFVIGGTLKSKLTREQTAAIDTSPGQNSFKSWLMSSLARADGFLAGSAVWDGALALDAGTKSQAEEAAQSLSKKLGAPVYVDISIGGKDPAGAAFFSGAGLSADFKDSGALVIALSISGTQIAGSLQTNNSNLWGKYDSGTPWQSSKFSATAASEGDVPAQLLAAIKAVGTPTAASSGSGSGSGSGSSGSGGGGIDLMVGFLVLIVIALVAIGLGNPSYRSWLISKISAVIGAVKGGPTTPPVGADAAQTGSGGLDFQFDAAGNPAAGEVAGLVGAVQGGSLPTTQGSADRLMATGTHGTAVVTSCQPLGRTVRDVNPKAPADRLDDPIWVFTVEVSVAGESPFPAVFGHRVPVAKAASVAPGVKLAVAVDMSNRNQEVAIDWDDSPIGG